MTQLIHLVQMDHLLRVGDLLLKGYFNSDYNKILYLLGLRMLSFVMDSGIIFAVSYYL